MPISHPCRRSRPTLIPLRHHRAQPMRTRPGSGSGRWSKQPIPDEAAWPAASGRVTAAMVAESACPIIPPTCSRRATCGLSICICDGRSRPLPGPISMRSNRLDQMAGDRQQSNRRMISELTGLNDQCGPRLAAIAPERHDNPHHLASSAIAWSEARSHASSSTRLA
jgi:hypothetical protein